MGWLQDRIDDRFTPLFDAEKKCKNLYELFIDRATILFFKIIFDILHDILPLILLIHAIAKCSSVPTNIKTALYCYNHIMTQR